jgi:hypothetical protein
MSTQRTKRMTAEEFDRHLTYLDLTQTRLSELTGVHLSTIYRWARAEEFPLWLALLLTTMRHNRYLKTASGRQTSVPSRISTPDLISGTA